MPKSKAPQKLTPRNSRKGIANKTQADRQLEQEQSISALISESIIDGFKDMTPKQRADFLKSLPSSVYGSILTQFIPKKKDTNEELKAQAISLTESYKDLKSLNDLSQNCHVLATELRKAKRDIRKLEFLQDSVFERDDYHENKLFRGQKRGLRRKISALFRQVYTDAEQYMLEKKEQVIPLKEWNVLLDEIINDHTLPDSSKPLKVKNKDRRKKKPQVGPVPVKEEVPKESKPSVSKPQASIPWWNLKS